MVFFTRLCITLCWGLAFAEPMAWMIRGWLHGEGRLHGGLALLLAVAWWARKGVARPAVDGGVVHPSWGAWSLLFGGWMALRLLPPFNSLQAFLLVVSAYGLSGLWMEEITWRRSRGAAVCAAWLLPVSHHVDTVFGFPMRRLLAAGVARVLGGVDVSTVLSIEGGLAVVDTPCAGVQSLWTASLILTVAAWWRGRTLNLSWALTWVATIALVVLGNACRVGMIVGIHHRLGLPLLADVLHVPIGLLVFGMALLPGLLWMKTDPSTDAAPRSRTPNPGRGSVFGLGLAIALSLLPPTVHSGTVRPELELPSALVSVEPSVREREFVEQQGGTLRKGTLVYGDFKAAVALIRSHRATAQHTPAWCHEGAGWTVGSDNVVRLDGMNVRTAALHRGGDRAVAVWWFQRGLYVTPDHAERLFAPSDPRPWTLVSLVAPSRTTLDDPEFLLAVRTLRTQLGDSR